MQIGDVGDRELEWADSRLRDENEWQRKNAKENERGLALYLHRTSERGQNVIKPMMSMSRPENLEGSVKGGYDQERGGYVEGEIRFSWGGSKTDRDSDRAGTAPPDKNPSDDE